MFRLKVEYITLFLVLLVVLLGFNILGNKTVTANDEENIAIIPNPKNSNLKVSEDPTAQVEIVAVLSLDKLLERPLFSETRKPRDTLLTAAQVKKVVDQVKKPVKVVEKKEMVLRGIFKKEDLSEALISVSEAKAEWYRVNDIIEGWQIEQISDDEVVLSREGETKKIKLYNY